MPACASQLAAATVLTSIVMAMPRIKLVMQVPGVTLMEPITTVLPGVGNCSRCADTKVPGYRSKGQGV